MNDSELKELEKELSRAGLKPVTGKLIYEQWRAPGLPIAILIERYADATFIWRQDRRSPSAIIDEIRAAKEAVDKMKF